LIVIIAKWGKEKWDFGESGEIMSLNICKIKQLETIANFNGKKALKKSTQA
jgi:hypothetical protein